jgi:dTDP-4-amino-4,6-dideoxygalactose transaminase
MTNSALQRTVPYVNVAIADSSLRDELIGAFTRVLSSGQFVLGDDIAKFEKRFATLCGTRFAISVNSGTDAMILSLRSLDIGPGDEVITAPNSYIATAAAIALVGARPVFVDVGTDFNIDATLIEAAITPRTRAILPVHLTGRPADMDTILGIAEKHDLSVIEDSAQAVLARHHGRCVGGLGTLGAFSLHPLKTLSVVMQLGQRAT